MMNTIEIKKTNKRSIDGDIIKQEIENLKKSAIRGTINKNLKYAIR